MNRIKGKKLTVFLFIMPAIILFTVFGIFPLVPTIFYSFSNYQNLKVQGFIGLANYTTVLHDSIFWIALLNTLKLLLTQYIFATPLSLILAILISTQNNHIRRFFKTTSFMPAVLSVTIVCEVWYMLVQPDWGAVNGILNALGFGKLYTPWLDSPKYAFNIIILTAIWQYIGFNMLLFYAGIKAIPESYYEAAYLEGANYFQQTVRITIPLLQETVKFVMILTTAGTMGMIANVQLMTQGNPIGECVYTIVYYIYYKAFGQMDFGQAYAIGIIYAVIGFCAIFLINRFIANKRLEYT